MDTVQSVTPASLRTLLEHVVDYAGLFPPAKLDMGPTVANYARDLACDDAWMLERLVVPTARLAEMVEAAGDRLPRGDEDEPWAISALTRAASDPDGLAEDLAAIEAFNARHVEPAHGLALVDVIELRADDADDIERALDAMPDELFPFFELPWSGDPRGLVATLVGGEAGAKIRTGGVEAALFPPLAETARFIAACARADVPFKATAGLHHPLRHRDETLGADVHGFLNVFTAAVLAREHDLDADLVERILAETSVDAFAFEADGLRWDSYHADLDAIEDARLAFAISFGSCSFDEPREDLRGLGLL